MEKFKTIIMLTIICIISFLILSYKLSEVPNGVYLDEATTGYNAYSISKTGRDEYGKEFPLAFRFFGSYSPPLYTYLTVIPVLIYGLNEFSVRIVSVILGVLMILVMYGYLKQSNLVNKKIIYSLLFLFIITPWNFLFTRTGYEIYLGFSLFSTGVFFSWMGLKNRIVLPIGLAILSLSTYAAHAQIYSAPLFILGFLLLFHKFMNKKFLVVGLAAALIIQIPHITLLGTQAFLNKSDLFYSDEIILSAGKILLLPQIISIPLSFAYAFFSKAVTYFSPYSLFFLADPDPQRSIPELSVFYSWMIAPFLIGVFVFLNNIKENFVRLLLLLTVVSVVPAALTGDPFSTQRSLSLLLPLFLITSFGLSSIFEKIGFRKFFPAMIMLFLLSAILLWRSYFILLPLERADAWNYGYKELVRLISENPQTQYLVENIKDKPIYIELAFFLKTDPLVLQNSVDPKIKNDYYNLSKFNPDYRFENIKTGGINWEKDIYKSQILIGDELMISQTQALEHDLSEVFTINNPRGYPIIRGFLTNPEKKMQRNRF